MQPADTQDTAQAPAKLFYSYSSKDERYLQKLQSYMAGLRRNGKIRDWGFRKIRVGEEGDKKIDNQLMSADVIVFLVSSDFIASEYCMSTEVQKAMERHNAGDAVLVPVMVRPCTYEETPFRRLQYAPAGKPITMRPNQDQAFSEVARAIGEVAAQMRSRRLEAARAEHIPTNIRLRCATQTCFGSARFIGRLRPRAEKVSARSGRGAGGHVHDGVARDRTRSPS